MSKNILDKYKNNTYDVVRSGAVVCLHINGKETAILGFVDREVEAYNLNTIARKMAQVLDDLLSIEEKLDCMERKYSIYYDIYDERWKFGTTTSPNEKQFKTGEVTILASEILNQYKGMLFGIKMGEKNEKRN